MANHTIDTLRVVLIKPTKYDDDGYVMRFWRGVLPSNTLNVLNGLTEAVKNRKVLGNVAVEISRFDETAEKVPVKKIIRWSRRRGTKVVVGLVGVQTNQYPRALDMGREFRAAGLDVIIGGFHTSGTINMMSDQEPDIQELVREGIIVVSGEVEEAWGDILNDALHDRLKPIYSYAQDLQNLIDLGKADEPVIDTTLMRHFADSSFGTMDTSRGCPFSCSFCTIINVQGRKMRERSPDDIASFIRKNYFEKNIQFYFFTDDNFARKRYWRETFEALIELQKEGVRITFMMQVDLARKPKDFVKLAAKAGCAHVFIGMESVNPENLAAEGKGQNKVEEYAGIMKEWHDVDVAVQTGYIIGLPHDTKEGSARDVKFLIDEIQPDWASFFMMTPLPGSQDHLEMKKAGAWMDPDFNKRDSFHATIEHPNMTEQEWDEAYYDAWRTFYSKENIIRILSRWNHNPHMYWSMLWVLLWYKHSALVEKTHPMVAGLFRLKDRTARRSGYAVDSLAVHTWKRTKELGKLVVIWAKLLKEFEEIWLQTRKPSETEQKWVAEAAKIQGEIWRTLHIAEWQERYRNARATLPGQAKALLDPFEELTSNILASGRDLRLFMAQWERVQGKLQDLCQSVTAEGEAVQKSLLELSRILKTGRPTDKVQGWYEAYNRLKKTIPETLRFIPTKFDALSNRVVYSRQDLNQFWSVTVQEIRSHRLWQIRPLRLITAAYQDLRITADFAAHFRMNHSKIN